MNDLGEILEAQSRLRAALACATRSVSIMRDAAGQIQGSDGYRILARSPGLESRCREAEAPLKEAIAVAETALGAQQPGHSL